MLPSLHLLTLCIPTYQRAGYLRDLLDSLVGEFAAPDIRAAVDILIADNASTDDTPALVASYLDRLPIRYVRNPSNIGGDRNFHLLITQAGGKYIWLVGDDETIAAGALTHILGQLHMHQPGLLILRAQCGERDWFENPLPLPAHFADYSAMVAYYAGKKPWPLLAHSLISLNVFQRDSFSVETQSRYLDTPDYPYSHMYGLVTGLRASGGAIHLSELFTVIVRETRAPIGLDKLVARRLWRGYFIWLGESFGNKKLIRAGRRFYGPSKQFRAWRKSLFKRVAACFTASRG